MLWSHLFNKENDMNKEFQPYRTVRMASAIEDTPWVVAEYSHPGIYQIKAYEVDVAGANAALEALNQNSPMDGSGPTWLDDEQKGGVLCTIDPDWSDRFPDTDVAWAFYKPSRLQIKEARDEGYIDG
jgi:hypothetical protein